MHGHCFSRHLLGQGWDMRLASSKMGNAGLPKSGFFRCSFPQHSPTHTPRSRVLAGPLQAWYRLGRMLFCLAAWFAGLPGCLVACLFGSLLGFPMVFVWLPGCAAAWLLGCLGACLLACLLACVLVYFDFNRICCDTCDILWEAKTQFHRGSAHNCAAVLFGWAYSFLRGHPKFTFWKQVFYPWANKSRKLSPAVFCNIWDPTIGKQTYSPHGSWLLRVLAELIRASAR